MEASQVISNMAMPQQETLLLNDYSYYRLKQSTIDPNKVIKSDLRLICPRCNEELEFPGYGERTRCTECNLELFIHGSELICSV